MSRTAAWLLAAAAEEAAEEAADDLARACAQGALRRACAASRHVRGELRRAKPVVADAASLVGVRDGASLEQPGQLPGLVGGDEPVEIPVDEEHRGVVFFAFTDDHNARHWASGEDRAHGIDRGAVGTDLVAAADPARCSHCCSLCGADKFKCEVAVWALCRHVSNLVPWLA
jgi:hypothetical protein